MCAVGTVGREKAGRVDQEEEENTGILRNPK